MSKTYLTPSMQMLTASPSAIIATSLKVGGLGIQGDVAEIREWNIFDENNTEEDW